MSRFRFCARACICSPHVVPSNPYGQPKKSYVCMVFFSPPWTLVLSQSSCFLVSTKMERIPPIIIPLCKLLSGWHSPYPNFFGGTQLLPSPQKPANVQTSFRDTFNYCTNAPQNRPPPTVTVSACLFFFAFTYTKQTPFPLPLPQPCQYNPALSSVFF